MDTGVDRNTLANAKAKAINENHMNRYCIQKARNKDLQTFVNEEKFSTTTGNNEKYLAYRVGKQSFNSIAIIRMSAISEISTRFSTGLNNNPFDTSYDSQVDGGIPWSVVGM